MNRLATEKSPYLRHASNQKIDWFPWSEKAFAIAEHDNKPVFLSSGAAWCHWCHVMARESFEDEEVARLLNENFISIKLDRDERPDIDRRYQQAVQTMGFSGGWPLNVFLTADKIPFFGGTYFPPGEGIGRPGFKQVLKAVAEQYKARKGDITNYGRRIIEALKSRTAGAGEIERRDIDDAEAGMLARFDPEHGGFGSSPKFPMPGAMAFLINRYFLARRESIGCAVRKTLESMARGGFHDQIGGGFHRYSVDEGWIVPHFEKMADDNAWLLRNYLDAYSVFGGRSFRETAEDILRFTGEVLSDPDGGFYASQDADVDSGDEGSYFTWTREEFREALNDEEYQVLSLHFFHERGSLHHDRSKKVLFVATDPEEIAKRSGLDVRSVSGIIRAGKKRLLDHRNRRKPPFIDKTLYTSLNGMLISSYLKAFRVLGVKGMRDFALRSLDKITGKHLTDGTLFHTEGVRGLLDDYIYLIEALIAAYEASGDASCLLRAENIMERCLANFWDENGGGFFDTEDEVVGMRLTGIEDIPHPSSNSLGIILLLKLYWMTGKETYLRNAEISLRTFAPQAKDFDLHAGYYYCALDAFFNMINLKVMGGAGSELGAAAVSSFHPYLNIVYGEDKGLIIPCVRDTCYEPIESPEKLRDFLRPN